MINDGSQISTYILPALQEKESDLISLLPEHIDIHRFRLGVVNEVARNPKLLECTKTSLQSAFLASAHAGLEPNSWTGTCYIIPYDKKATCVVGYKGLIELVTRAGICDSVDAKVVYERDLFVPKAGTSPAVEHELYVEKSTSDSRGHMLGVYAVAFLGGGKSPKFEYLPESECLKIRKESRAGSNPQAPWNKHFEMMCKKRAIKRVIQTLPKSLKVDSKSGLTLSERINLASEASEGGDGYVHVEGKGIVYRNSEPEKELTNDSHDQETVDTQENTEQKSKVQRPIQAGKFDATGRFRSFRKTA